MSVDGRRHPPYSLGVNLLDDQAGSLARLQAHCREKAHYAFGTIRIFEKRARSLQIRRNLITYLGIVVPLLVGAAVLSVGTGFVPYVAVPAGLLGMAQLALSVWSVVAHWDDAHGYAVGAMQANIRLFNAWDALAKRPPENLQARVEALDSEDQRQEQADMAQHITEKEKRYAMRATLYQYGLACERCKTKPASMKPGKYDTCDTCGNF